jgi:outer membrane protein TolC
MCPDRARGGPRPGAAPRPSRPSAGVAALALAAAALPGCASFHDEKSRRETDGILTDLSTQVSAERDAAHKAAAAPPRAARTDPALAIPEVLDLAAALRIAGSQNRGILADRDGLVLSALALLDAQNAIGPRLNGTIRHALADTDRSEKTFEQLATLGATATLPTGAQATVTADASKTRGASDGIDSAATGGVTARISQPLLRGAGYDASHEALTDAQRQALYDVRQYELSRQDLALEVQRSYYLIVTQKQVIRNREAKLESLEFLRRRSERLFDLGRVSEVDKFRATREYLTAENDLVDARQELDARLDAMKVLLGLDTAVKIDVAETIPAPRKVDLDFRRAIEAALANRLDLMTARDQVADAERRESIRERDVLPDLRVELTGRRASDDAHGFSDMTPLERDSWGAGVVLELPLDRVRERNALRAARIEVERTRRDLTLAEDSVILDVRSALRGLRAAESSLKIQEEITVSEEKNARIAKLRFEEGTIGNRDLTDAYSNLADAQDRLVREKANLETARVRLHRAVGTLTMNEDGTWRE